MKITIKSIHIENFKGINMLDVNFSVKTKISGQNAVGKTTIFDAFTWLLFNKNSAGEHYCKEIEGASERHMFVFGWF